MTADFRQTLFERLRAVTIKVTREVGLRDLAIATPQVRAALADRPELTAIIDRFHVEIENRFMFFPMENPMIDSSMLWFTFDFPREDDPVWDVAQAYVSAFKALYWDGRAGGLGEGKGFFALHEALDPHRPLEE